MSEAEFEAAEAGGVEGGLDPFAEGFGESLGATVHEAVQAGIDRALGGLGTSAEVESEPEPEFVPGYEPEPTAEEAAELAEGEAQVSQWVAGLKDELGPFDEDRAREAAEELFPLLEQQMAAESENGEVDPHEVARAAVLGGALTSMQEDRGQGFLDQLLALESRRVGGQVDRDAVEGLANELVASALAQGAEGPEAGVEAIRAAATALADKPGRYQSPESLAHYYAARGMLDRQMETPLPLPGQQVKPEPGRPQSVDQIVARHAPRVRAESQRRR